jgi:diketogulonate reductase-like aldo/keto reductase
MVKLKSDYVDLYLMHWPLKTTRKDTWKAMEKLYKEGRAKAIGVANYLIPFLIELYEYADIIPTVNQVEFSPYLFLKDLLEHCNQKKIRMQAYTPLLRGLKLHDSKLVSIAEKYHKTTAQIKLRWCIQHGVCPIPKSVNPIRLKENFDLFDFQISEEDMQKLDAFHEGLRVVDDPISML